MKLASPTHAVIGCSDLEASAEFLRRFGFTESEHDRLPAAAAAALYGLEMETEERVVRVPGAARGWLRLVATPVLARQVATLDNRAFAIDLFSTDLEASLEIAAAGGWPATPIATHQFGPLVIREVEIRGPDELILTLLETTARRPTILDAEPSRPHSELHALVWSVVGADEHLAFWQRKAGLVKVTDAVFESEGLGATLGLGAGRSVKARLIVLSDEADRPARFELIEFLGETAADHPSWPLAAGLHAPAFHVEDLEVAVAALQPEAIFGEILTLDTPLHRGATAVSGATEGGVRFELWSEA